MVVLPPPINARHERALRAYAEQAGHPWQEWPMPQAEQVLELAGRIAEHVAKVRQVGDRYVRLLTIHDAQLLDAQLLASVGQLLVESAKPHLPNNDAYVRSSLGHSLLEVGSARESVVTRHYP